MDYQFSNDFIGDPVACCSMGHEAIGNWLTAEIGSNTILIGKLQHALQQLQQRTLWEYHLDGIEYAIELTREQAIVRAHSLFADTDNLTDELDYYDAESLAHCGLQDFATLLSAWCQFIGLAPQPS